MKGKTHKNQTTTLKKQKQYDRQKNHSNIIQCVRAAIFTFLFLFLFFYKYINALSLHEYNKLCKILWHSLNVYNIQGGFSMIFLAVYSSRTTWNIHSSTSIVFRNKCSTHTIILCARKKEETISPLIFY